MFGNYRLHQGAQQQMRERDLLPRVLRRFNWLLMTIRCVDRSLAGTAQRRGHVLTTYCGGAAQQSALRYSSPSAGGERSLGDHAAASRPRCFQWLGTRGRLQRARSHNEWRGNPGRSLAAAGEVGSGP